MRETQTRFDLQSSARLQQDATTLQAAAGTASAATGLRFATLPIQVDHTLGLRVLGGRGLDAKDDESRHDGRDQQASMGSEMRGIGRILGLSAGERFELAAS